MDDTQVTAPDEMPVTEPQPAPEIFSEGYSSVSIDQGVAKFLFISITQTAAGRVPERRAVLRLTVPLGAVLGMHQAIGNLIDQLRKAGTIMDKPPGVEGQN